MAREYIGVDLHKQFFQACAVSGTGDRLWEGRFPRTAGGVGLLMARCGIETAVAVEATGPTWAFVDQLQPTGATICVIDPRKTKLKAGSRRRPIDWMRDGWPMPCDARAS